jgi:hypothetical protein
VAANPFKPTAGKMPPILIGRQNVIDDFTDGLRNGAGAPGRLMLITGQRGYGKTVMLTELTRVAEGHGWVTIQDVASEGLCSRLVDALDTGGLNLRGASIRPTVGIPGVAEASLGQMSFSARAEGPATLRAAINKRLESRKIDKGKGILFTIDETQAASRDDLVAIATAIQHVIADQDRTDVPDIEKKGVAFVFAGLPSLVDELVNDKVLTFLRRSLRRTLGEVPIPDVKNAYIQTVRESGKAIGEPEAAAAAQITTGYPYLVQLVGYYMWQSAERDGRFEISADDVQCGYQDALVAFGDAVCAPAIDGLGTSARAFVEAMAQDEGPSRSSEIADRLNMSRSWGNKYRQVLINELIVKSAGQGYIEFAIPHMAEWLRRRSK